MKLIFVNPMPFGQQAGDIRCRGLVAIANEQRAGQELHEARVHCVSARNPDSLGGMQLEVEAYSGTAGAVTMAQEGPHAREGHEEGRGTTRKCSYGRGGSRSGGGRDRERCSRLCGLAELASANRREAFREWLGDCGLMARSRKVRAPWLPFTRRDTLHVTARKRRRMHFRTLPVTSYTMYDRCCS